MVGEVWMNRQEYHRASGTAKMQGAMPGWRGVLYFQSSTPKWGVLNGIAIVYEYETDADENTPVKLWDGGNSFFCDSPFRSFFLIDN
jgi:hypothetical protein